MRAIGYRTAAIGENCQVPVEEESRSQAQKQAGTERARGEAEG